ncbi:alpha/beta hydrolase family protein [Pseudovibrio sp. Alg231-02]|uniref:alpha/beta hydrolase family protein n=1 Tax=Pseudovibrio sp. Alg231-02 TaxID=1922223 RepID=UPI000D54D903|nr:alpha/beta fold hydrolase [Pseudovibrio sp. Alg231-02]
MKERVEIDAKGATLSGEIFVTEGIKPEHAIVLHPALGVKRRFYTAFAEWLAEEQQAACLIYDYRLHFKQLSGLKEFERVTLSNWGCLDQSAALDCLAERFPDSKLHVVGHSIGGTMVPFHQQRNRVNSVRAVCSGLGYWKYTPMPYKLKIWFFWFVAGPLSVMLTGQLSRKVMGLATDLPADLFWQWRRWCLSPSFHRIDWGNQLPLPEAPQFNGMLKLLSVADDWMIPPKAVSRLAEFYPNAAHIEHLTIQPSDIDTTSLGHVKIFAESSKKAWPKIFSKDELDDTPSKQVNLATGP